MTTAKTPKAPPGFTLPEPPDSPRMRKLTAFDQLSITGNALLPDPASGQPRNHPRRSSELYIIAGPNRPNSPDMSGVRSTRTW